MTLQNKLIKMEKSHKLYGLILLGVLVNLLVPFLGLYMVSDRSNIKKLALLGIAASALLLIAFDQNDLLFHSIYIKGSSNVVFTLLFAGAVVSSFLVYRDRHELNIKSNSVFFVLIVLISWQIAHQAYALQSKVVAADSLSPYLRAGSVVVFGKSSSESNNRLRVVKNQEDGSYSVGFLLASSGDSIGSSDGVPIICEQNPRMPSCFEVTDVCKYLKSKAKKMDGNMEMSTSLPQNEVILANFLSIPDYDALKNLQKNAEDVYNVFKIFDTRNAVSFGLKPVSLDCESV